ncbi:MAG TPA: efflux RND transporter periplasmic adaptor subunit [Ottowia sp.]|uniref:HlyD family secretion protein n=1 Tax=Ottowia sp. TaxID=1898956 RepID=UPI002B981D3A|nr:efflux RND transporter periplasmic adaptor subunit [Ottowia sp.]HMN20791.1 efflux RND transporter periplasmic adaptor subunit [Ottowia sp.]
MSDAPTTPPAASPEAPQHPSSSTVTATPRGMHPLRKRALLTVTAVVLLAAIAWALYDWLVLRHEEYTDNAYVQGDVVQITPQQGGTVTAIHADETDRVQAGQALVELDGADARVALAQAEAALGQAVRQVRTLYVNNASLQAQVGLREADLAKARTQLASARQDLQRRQGLVPGGAVSAEELAHARTQVAGAQSTLDAAQAAVRAAREQLASNRALTDGTPVAEHPSVLAAAARVREAWLAVRRTVLPAPVAGYVSKRVVQLGQRVAPGAPLMSVVPLDALWVDANFKENQLGVIRIGQPVRLTADLYGGKVVFDGRVVGLGIATGAASALLPAQNATGNWIKVVQRVPVRIALDPQQLRAHPLRLGLSMEATVDVTDQDGAMLAEAAKPEPLARTPVFADAEQGAEARVREIIAHNLGTAAAAGS